MCLPTPSKGWESPRMFHLRITVRQEMFRNFPVKSLVWVTEGAGVEKMGPRPCMADGGGHPYPPLEPQDPHRAVSSSNSEGLPLTASVSICCFLSLCPAPHPTSFCLCPFSFLSFSRLSQALTLLSGSPVFLCLCFSPALTPQPFCAV